MSRWVQNIATLAVMVLMTGCTGIPDNVKPVDGFKLVNYLGRWYEVARLDHRFEKGLTHVQAIYLPMDDGGIQVVNEGFDPESGRWRVAMGRAYFNGSPHRGRLKVAFFGPFYSGYNIIALDQRHYQWAMVSGPNHQYLWILSRRPHLSASVKAHLLRQARQSGFAVDRLIWVDQQPPAPVPPPH